LSVSEELTRVREAEPAKEADRQDQKVCGTDQVTWLGLTTLLAPTGPEAPTSSDRIFHPINRVNPTDPACARYPDRKEGGRSRGQRRVGESEGWLVTGQIGPRERRYPIRKDADFRQVSTRVKRWIDVNRRRS
jgi:hypothetical protein